MNTPLLTIAQAGKITGRSGSTIRRLIHTITQDDKHPDRGAIEPDPKQVAAFKKKGEGFTWKISEEVVVRNFGRALKEEQKSVAQPQGILDILQHELELKNQQIEKQWEVIHALNDRLREGNILMGSLQKRLALPETTVTTEPVVEAVAATPSKEAPQKASKEKVKATPAKKGLFSWLRK